MTQRCVKHPGTSDLNAKLKVFAQPGRIDPSNWVKQNSLRLAGPRSFGIPNCSLSRQSNMSPPSRRTGARPLPEPSMSSTSRATSQP